jgi:predicted neuraminidase
MNPALMFDTLNLNNRFVGRCVQHAVAAAGAWVIKIYRTPQRFGPESCGLINIGGLAIDQYCA